jgi:uncharacterized hydrophobic protein (TIGR00271 family)
MSDPTRPRSPHPLGKRLADARRRGLDPQERRRVMAAVALRTGDGWRSQFWLLQTLSVTVAVMGLSADSAAVVIGAMLLAPLMVPVLGIAAAMAMALPGHLGRSLRTVVLASLGSVLLAYVLALALPDGQLSTEVLARTSPDLRDLVVALAAGIAGAYATVRADVSTSLPGVAVAVALVPPLATIGMTLEAGRRDLAEGAILLYAANLTGIVLVGVAVFLVTGFVPPSRIRDRRRHVSGAALLVAGATFAVAIPLTLASIGASQDGRERDRVRAAAAGWIQGAGDELDEVRVDGDRVRIRVSGPNTPPPTADLERSVRQILGPDAVVEVRWTQTQVPPSEATIDQPTEAELDAERRDAAVAEAIDAWLADADATVDVDEVRVGDEIRIDLTSAEPPPPVERLTERLRAEAGISLPVVVNWTQRTILRPGDAEGGGTSLDAVRREVEEVARPWARGIEGVTVLAVAYDGDLVTIDLAGPDPAVVDDVEDLERQVAAVVPVGTEIRVWFSLRVPLLPAPSTTTTVPPTTTTVPPTTTAPPGTTVPPGTTTPGTDAVSG